MAGIAYSNAQQKTRIRRNVIYEAFWFFFPVNRNPSVKGMTDVSCYVLCILGTGFSFVNGIYIVSLRFFLYGSPTDMLKCSLLIAATSGSCLWLCTLPIRVF